MKNKFLKMAFAGLVLSVSGFANATPIALEYEVNDLGSGLYNYDFFLTLDNNDGTWQAGQGWDWLIFGDSPTFNGSPLSNFIGDANSFSAGPWSSFSFSSGGHNGPTLLTSPNYWVPTTIGETVSWSGSSTANLAQGELLFSTLRLTNSAVGASFEVANRVNSVPEPSTLAILGLGLMGLAARRFKK